MGMRRMKGGWSCDGVWLGLYLVHGRSNDGVVEVESILFRLEFDKGYFNT